MSTTEQRDHRTMLERIARRVMLERGLLPDFTLRAMAELDAIQGPATARGPIDARSARLDLVLD
jgi:hypothetical protein